MKPITRHEQKKAVEGWWNTDNIKKFDRQYDDYDVRVMRYQNSRQEKVLQFVDELKLSIGSKVLEIGYGAGQTALKLSQRGFELHGIDVSEKLCHFAKKRVKEEHPSGNVNLKVGNIESGIDYKNDTFDLVVMVGILHYTYNDEECLKDVKQVLKPGGHLIIAQRKIYSLPQFTNVRNILRFLVYLILRDEYELFPSFKAILCDSRLKIIFGRFKDSKIFNTKIMLKNHDIWKYKLKKRVYSTGKLKAVCRKAGFIFLKSDGTCYGVTEELKHHKLNLKVHTFLEKISKKWFMHCVTRLGSVTVILNKKREL